MIETCDKLKTLRHKMNLLSFTNYKYKVSTSLMFSFPEKETLKQYLANRCFDSNSVQLYVAFDYA